MSKFNRVIPVLVELTGKPLFLRMQGQSDAIPMAIGISAALESAAPDAESRTAITAALATLTHSKRYKLALQRKGAMRHDADDNPTELVADAHKTWAAELLRREAANIARRKAALVVKEGTAK